MSMNRLWLRIVATFAAVMLPAGVHHARPASLRDVSWWPV
jgi:hypothetical protein